VVQSARIISVIFWVDKLAILPDGDLLNLGEAMMDDIEEQQAMAMTVLEPHFATLTDIYKSAVDLYNEGTSPRIRAEHDSRAALNSIYALAWKGYEREFGDTAGLHLLNMRGLKVLNIADKVVARAKRVDANGRHVNNRTDQQKDFDRQLPLVGLPPEAVRLVIGYELDPAYSTVERVIVRHTMGDWVSQIISIDEEYHWEDITPVRLPLQGGARR
jgi:hypothetical protein